MSEKFYCTANFTCHKAFLTTRKRRMAHINNFPARAPKDLPRLALVMHGLVQRKLEAHCRCLGTILCMIRPGRAA